MKKIILLCLLIIGVLVVGCSTESPTNEQNTPLEAPLPETTIQDEPAKNVAPVNTENKKTSSEEVTIIGKDGFDKQSVTIKTGESVTFINDNPAELDKVKDEVLVIQGGSENLISANIADQGSYEHVFTESDEYLVWTVGFGKKMSITVE